ncbi:MAG: hypothetical protein KGK08_10130 [Acidobacteriota bacterium]|nr:hypothetical protein [Acidobacteriota bacterium]
MHTNHDEPNNTGHGPVDPEHPGYETTDVNVGGVAAFLVGLTGFVLVFFGFCFVMGRVINRAFEKADGPSDKWHQSAMLGGQAGPGESRENLKSSPEMQQKQLQQITAAFPSPRLDTDDGNQATADLHAREDLLLENYSSDGAKDGSIRIPIERAMELIAQRGLPVATQAGAAKLMTGDVKPVVTLPLTNGFARTGYELQVMEAREQKMNYGKATEGSTAEMK